MPLPVVGIVGNSYLIDNEYPIYASGKMNCEAIAHVTQALPLIFPSNPRIVSIQNLCESCDGFLFTGGKPNIHPEEYGEAATPAHGSFDRDRDSITLGLIKECVARGQPILGVCRGFQEFNVAFGGSLYPEIRELPGRMNHRMPPDGTIDEKFALRHEVTFNDQSCFQKIFDAKTVLVNSLHGQGIKKTGGRVVIDGYAPDSTPEAISIKGANGFALAVQWHPEFNVDNDPVSTRLFRAFGEALVNWKRSKSVEKLRVA
ncbi:MAG: gamma-glutamyl-gamma-aminobutyrate hydrolase family protein [Rhodobacteraceae bacterium]|nr:gamma-glutamyl-gamma-aminobutyrate hydrolase family protein [Paracoccaceae bacterium]